jgi:hypothetical protein
MRTTVRSTRSTLKSSEACDPPVMCLWMMKKKFPFSYRLFSDLHVHCMCVIMTIISFKLLYVWLLLWYYIYYLSYVCNLILAHIWDALGFPCKIGCDTHHKGSPLRHSPSSLGHLDAASTKELLHQWRGSPRPPHKVSSPLHTNQEGRRRLPVSHLGLKAFGEPCTPWFTQESPHKVGTTLHSLSSKLILSLSTSTKHMQVYWWAIKHLDGLDMIF